MFDEAEYEYDLKFIKFNTTKNIKSGKKGGGKRMYSLIYVQALLLLSVQWPKGRLPKLRTAPKKI